MTDLGTCHLVFFLSGQKCEQGPSEHTRKNFQKQLFWADIDIAESSPFGQLNYKKEALRRQTWKPSGVSTYSPLRDPLVPGTNYRILGIKRWLDVDVVLEFHGSFYRERRVQTYTTAWGGCRGSIGISLGTQRRLLGGDGF